VSARGRRASLPAAGHARPERVVEDGQGGLLVRHYDAEGRVREYSFASLPVAEPMQRSLATLFAARCTPGTWASHETSAAAWLSMQRFAKFLSLQQEPPRDLDGITVRAVQQWRENGDQRAFDVLSRLLRGDPRLQTGPVADELARRRKAIRGAVQSYSQAEFDRYAAAARRTFRTARQRINDNARHLERWRDGDFAQGSKEWVIGEGLDILARTGDLPRSAEDKYGKHQVRKKYREAFSDPAGNVIWQRLFLTREEAAALGVLLMAEFGWNLSVISRVKVPLASPDPGEDRHPTYRIELEKPRRGRGRHYETRNVTDHGAGSPGRLITHALQATRFARAIIEELAPGTDRLVAWRTRAGRLTGHDSAHSSVGLFFFGVDSGAAAKWAKTAGLGGSPFQRGRRTVLAIDRREPAQHSQDTHDRYYVLPDKRVQAGAVEVIAAGAEDAADLARQAVLAAELREHPSPADLETAVSDCAGFDDSPWPSPDGGCGASFLMCLACPNARIHPGHHPRLAWLHQALASLRSVLPPGAWATQWGDAHARLEDLRQRLGDGPWSQALSRVNAADRAIVTHLLTGVLDA